MQTLVKKFAKAGLTLVPATQTFAAGQNASDVFGLDIDRKVKGNLRKEFFRIWPGAPTNRIEVLDTDDKLQQLVLFVHEPSREFETELHHFGFKAMTKEEKEGWLVQQGGSLRDVVRFTKTGVVVKRRTPNEKRKFLLGVDERQLFIAQLTGTSVTNVTTARASLKTNTVTLAEGRMPGKTIRQGEWFFVNPTPDELEALQAAIRQNRAFIEHNIDIGQAADGVRGRGPTKPTKRNSGGNPHVAEDVVVVAGPKMVNGFSVRAREVYVRGKVRHVDHKTTKIAKWRRVIRNTEAGGATGGGSWVD